MLTLERGLTVGHTLLAVLTSPHFVSSFLCFYFHEGEGGGISTQDACNLRCFLSGHITEPCSSVVFPFLAMDQMCSASARSLKHDFLIFLFFFLSQYSSLLDHLLISSSLAAWLAPYNAELTGYVYFVCLFFFFLHWVWGTSPYWSLLQCHSSWNKSLRMSSGNQQTCHVSCVTLLLLSY